MQKGVFEADPFQSLDQEGVGELISLGVDRARAANPDIAVGLCGEHGGEPLTIEFCERARFDYVSCSPYRTPIARLAAAQAAIRAERDAAAGQTSDQRSDRDAPERGAPKLDAPKLDAPKLDTP